MESKVCKKYLDENYESYVIEYRGDFVGQMANVDYACGHPITDTLGVIAVQRDDLNRLRRDVPAIIFVEARSIYVLQNTSPSDVDKINQVKINPYLNLTGRQVLVALLDTGINYLNREFIREDDTSRILGIWDQSIESERSPNTYIGTTYTNDEINQAIQAQLKGEDPYAIVPSRDEVGHGTEMAGIIGARGYNGEMQGVANDCDFVVIKLLETPSYKKVLRENNLPIVPVYNNTEILAGVEYARQAARQYNRPLIVYFGVGSNEGSHDGYNITARYITNLAGRTGTVYVAGTGNQGNAEGHVRRFLNNVGEVVTVEMNMSKELRHFSFYIWVQRPSRMSLSIISPRGEETGFLVNQIDSVTTRNFYLIDTQLKVQGYDPESLTGHQVFILYFDNIKPGIWKFKLRGDIVSNGRVDIWLPPREVLPEGTRFLEPNPENTLTIPSTARDIVSVAHYNGDTNAIMAESGKGFDTNRFVRPDIATVGTNILTISRDGNRVIPVSGSSVATAVVAGASALLIQWGLIDQNDISISSGKARSLFIYGAERDPGTIYPNEAFGYGKMDLQEIFNILSGIYRNNVNKDSFYEESEMGDLFIRIPKNIGLIRGGE